MKILYLLADFPYPVTNGLRVHTSNMLKYMATNHECHVLGFCDDDLFKRLDDKQHWIPNVHIIGLFPRQSGLELQIGRIQHLLAGNPVFLAAWDSNLFVRAVTQALQDTNYDIVHLEGIPMVQYLDHCQAKPTVLSTIDAISLVYHRAADASKSLLKKAYRRFAARSIALFEYRNLTKATKLHVVSESDCQYLHSCFPGIDIDHIEIMVSKEIINYHLSKTRTREHNHPRIMFWGALSSDGIAKGLRSFLSESYPAILEAYSTVQMVVLGRDAPANLRKQMECVPNLHYIPWVKDYLSEIAKSHVIVLPDLSGTGIKNRVLQVMALSKPVVGTPLVFEGVSVEDGVHCFRRTVGKEFSQAVIALLKDGSLRDRIGISAKQLIIDKFSVEVLGQKWNELYINAVAKFRSEKGRD